MEHKPKRLNKSKRYLRIVRASMIAIIVVIMLIFVGVPKNKNIDDQPVSEQIHEPEPSFVFMSAVSNQSTKSPQKPVSTPVPTPEPTPEPMIMYYTEEDVITMAKVMYREAGGIQSLTEIACVGWVACNRYDSCISYFNSMSITAILTQPSQFAWIPNTPVEDRLVELAADVLQRWNTEKNTGECEGRVLPAEYLYFHGDGKHNNFRIKYEDSGLYWDYSLPSPYES